MFENEEFDLDDIDLEELDPEGHFKEKEKQQQKNEKLLQEFKDWLEAKGLSDKTVKKHVENIDFYINEYLTYYEVQGPEENVYEIASFLGDWFVRKAMWASKTAIKDYCAGFKKFYKFLEEKEMITEADYKELLSIIKERKSDWLQTISRYDDPATDIEDVWDF
jgi:intergrase/recombinase